MVCLLSISFVGPLRAPQTLTKGRRQFEFTLGRLSSMAAFGTAQKVVLGSSGSNERILSLNQSCQDHLMTRPRILSETSSPNLIVDYCTGIVISGYWVGPDVDDGWGFVEAVVTQLT